MTVGTVLEVELPRGLRGFVLNKVRGPGHLVRVHVEEPRLGVERRSTPFRSAVKAGEDDCLLIDAKRNKLRAAVKRPETLDSPAVRLRSPVGQHLFCQGLPGEREGLGGQWLGFG